MAISSFLLFFSTLLLGMEIYAEDCDLSDEGSLRLVGWIEADAGRVEICHNGEWGTVCVDPEDDAWSQKNAEVACRALRYSGARNSIHHKTIADSMQVSDLSVPIHYSQVRCTGEQESLLDCGSLEDTTGCTHRHDAAIVCRRGQSAGNVRLVGDLRDEVGAVELYYPQIGWTGICADRDHIDSWRNNDQAAEIVCRQLGYDGGAPYVDSLQQTVVSTRSIVIENCDAKEDFDLTNCDASTIDDCTSNDLAWVQCIRSNNDGKASKLGSTREGVMQLEFSGRMGYICDNEWDEIDAEVACVEFEQHDSRTDYDTNPEGDYTSFISDLKPIWLGGVECTYRIDPKEERRIVIESEVSDCDHSEKYPIGLTECHFESSSRRIRRIAQVDCGTAIQSTLVAAIAGGCVSFVIVCICCICVSIVCYEQREKLARRRSRHTYSLPQRTSTFEKVCGFFCRCGIVSLCIQTICTKLRPQVSAGDMATAAATEDTAPGGNRSVDVMESVEMGDVKAEEPEAKRDAEFTAGALPLYSESAKYTTVSASAVHTTV